MDNYVKNKLSSEIAYVWVPAGWAFKNQNSVGRLSEPYQFPNNIKVSQKGLVKQFRSDMPKAIIFDLETIFNQSLDECIFDCIDNYYFAYDGHWTPKANKLVSEVIINEFLD